MKVVVCVEAPLGQATRGALALARALPAAEVIALHVGTTSMRPADRPDTHRLVEVTTPELHAALPACARAEVLAAAVLRIAPALVLGGLRSGRGGRGFVPACLARVLGWPFVSQVGAVAPRIPSAPDGHTERAVVWAVRVEAAPEAIEVAVTGPVVLSCVPQGLPVPRERRGPLAHEQLSLKDLGVAAEALRRASDDEVATTARRARPRSAANAAAFLRALTREP
ncbi:MAG: hypothetical protein KA712_21095 [Myxococcales bacterium]|nr:hypothetical protein [Myxococcales bacterium]